MKLKEVLSLFLALMMLCAAMICPASADSAYRQAQLEQFHQMQNRKIDVEIDNSGGYMVKSTRFYAREVVGVDNDGNFILGGWKCLDSGSNEPMFTHRLTVNGTCVAFAYSCDVVWGTDFPYSGVFWNHPDKNVSKIEISLVGLCRAVHLWIKVDDKYVVVDPNCASHSEWKP